MLTIGDDKKISERLKKKKTAFGRDVQLTERLNAMIQSVNNNEDPVHIQLYFENMLARDSRSFREYVSKIQPNIDMTVEVVDEVTGEPFRGSIAFDTSFFWPEL